ncbi:hypothetical protein BOTBODRAFT_38174 [Botryobasidium botryosum FD-172 SS1]|uniref:Uncharacterized protein n=1 Tax=Botryobasidium botryosum (strain FD-172 SS1) TaxID=930990 RepID=A0A067M9C1_BOTB1|nr:hypothetical protein BOTBODRAFT_38174 [Botryobasidium botryosum FD-172 SS1]
MPRAGRLVDALERLILCMQITLAQEEESKMEKWRQKRYITVKGHAVSAECSLHKLVTRRHTSERPVLP